MNYRDFFKNKRVTRKDILSLLPEGVDQKEFDKGIGTEKEHTDDEFMAAKIAGDHLKEDPKYYTKLSDAGLEEEDVDECGTCGCGDPSDDHSGEDYDDNGGLPKVGGALAVPHRGQPIMMGKIIQVGGIGGGPANGALGGMTNAGAKDKGVPATQPGDKEPITAGGKQSDSSIASKSVGGQVVPGEGQEQGGPNSQGTIAGTSKLTESKNKVRRIVKNVLKEIRFDKGSGKWVKLNEGHKAGCKCGFCANKGTFGKKKDKKEDKEDVDENVDMKMGPSYKVVQPRQYKVSDDDFARTNQYDPEITEMYDDEEECMMNERYVELANAGRNLSEAELSELKVLREKIDRIAISKRNYGLSQGGVEPSVFEGRCEDFPCCGHEDGDCPDRDQHGNETWKCAKCGARLPKNSRSSLCSGCIQRMNRAMDDPTGQDMDDFQENTVNMKMGPSHKTVQQTLAKTAAGDFARTNQYDPQVSEVLDVGEQPPVHQGHKGQSGFRLWVCSGCGHELNTPSTERRPDPIRWTDGHVCNFVPAKDGEGVGAEPMGIGEAGGGAVQHSSYRTVDHGNLPQKPKQRWADDLDESNKKKPSKVVKAITKGQKPATTKKDSKLKFKAPKKTTSGVHKRKT